MFQPNINDRFGAGSGRADVGVPNGKEDIEASAEMVRVWPEADVTLRWKLGYIARPSDVIQELNVRS